MVLPLKEVLPKGSFVWSQWLAASIVSLMGVVVGLMCGWTSPYLAKLTTSDSELPITESEGSWIASLLNVGRTFGAIFGAVIVGYIGSKKCLHVTGIPSILGWLCVILANSAIWLYAARIFLGLSMGMFFAAFPLYIGETSHSKMRGAMVGIVIAVGPIFGTFLGNIIGAVVALRSFTYISLVPNVLFLVTFYFLPDTPHYLVYKEDTERATQAIRWYHREDDTSVELKAVQTFVKTTGSKTFSEKWAAMNTQTNRRALLMITILFFYVQMSGLNSIAFYMETILINAKLTIITPSVLVVIISSLQTLASLVAVYAIDRYGRRPLLVVSSAGVAISMIILGTHFMLLSRGYPATSLQALPIVALLMFLFLFIGLLPVSMTILSELFPANIKSVAACIGGVSSAIFAFVSSKTYQPLVELISEQYVFWIYALIMITAVVYSLYGIPETKGKTLLEIQRMMTKEDRKGVSGEKHTINA